MGIFLRLAACVSCLLTVATASAQTYPTRPLRMIVPLNAGSGGDVAARFYADAASRALGQTIIVDNKPGAAGNIGAAAAAQAQPDGYTIAWGTNATHASNLALFDSIGYDPVKDFEPIAGLAEFPVLLLGRKGLAAGSVKEIMDISKAKPRTFSLGLPSGTARVIFELIKEAYPGVDFVGVPYKGEDVSLTDMLGGRLDLTLVTTPVAKPRVERNELNGLAITTGKRSPVMPAIATFVEQGGAAVVLSPWAAVWGPKGTPAQAIQVLNTAFNKSQSDPKVMEFLQNVGAVAMPGTPAELARFQKSEIEKWGRIIRKAGIKG